MSTVKPHIRVLFDLFEMSEQGKECYVATLSRVRRAVWAYEQTQIDAESDDLDPVLAEATAAGQLERAKRDIVHAGDRIMDQFGECSEEFSKLETEIFGDNWAELYEYLRGRK